MKKIFVIFLLTLTLTACSRVEYTPKVAYHPPLGSDVAAIKVVEWGDFQCPACGVAYQQLGSVWAKYEAKIQRQFRHYPLSAIHPYAFTASAASECAAEQGKFWEYHDLLYQTQANLMKKDLISDAEKLGMNKTDFENCLNSQAKSPVVRQDVDEGRKLGIDSTPTFFVNGQKIADWTQMEAILAGLVK